MKMQSAKTASILKTALFSATALMLSFEAYAADSYSWNYATYGPPGNVAAKSVEAWLADVDEASDADIEMDFFFSESLLSAAEMMRGIADGRADMGYMAAQYHPAELPLAQITGIPFVTRDTWAQARAVHHLYHSNEAFAEEFNRNGVHLLNVAPLASNIIISNKPIETPEDLEGASIRIVGYSQQAVRQMGANPVAITQPEVYEALERGVLDMSSSVTIDIATDFNYQEVVDYFVDPGIGVYALTINVMSLDLWESLDDDLKAVINERNEQDATHSVSFLSEAEVSACDKALDAGVQVSVLSDETIADWVKSAQQEALDAWMQDARDAGVEDPEAFWEEYVGLIRHYEEQSDYVPGTLECAEKSLSANG